MTLALEALPSWNPSILFLHKNKLTVEVRGLQPGEAFADLLGVVQLLRTGRLGQLGAVPQIKSQLQHFHSIAILIVRLQHQRKLVPFDYRTCDWLSEIQDGPGGRRGLLLSFAMEHFLLPPYQSR